RPDLLELGIEQRRPGRSEPARRDALGAPDRNADVLQLLDAANRLVAVTAARKAEPPARAPHRAEPVLGRAEPAHHDLGTRWRTERIAGAGRPGGLRLVAVERQRKYLKAVVAVLRAEEADPRRATHQSGRLIDVHDVNFVDQKVTPLEHVGRVVGNQA